MPLCLHAGDCHTAKHAPCCPAAAAGTNDHSVGCCSCRFITVNGALLVCLGIGSWLDLETRGV